MSGVVGSKVRMTALAAVLGLLVLPFAGTTPAVGADKPSVKLSKSQAGHRRFDHRHRHRMAAEDAADDADLRPVGAVPGGDRRHQLLCQRRRSGRHHRREGRLQQGTAGRRAARAVPLRGARRHGHGGEGGGGRHLHGRRALGRAAARGGERRTALGAHGHPARRIERAAHLVRRPALPHARLHGRQCRHRLRQGPRLPSRHLPRRVRPAVGGTAVARHHRARQEGADQTPRRTRGRGARRLHRLAEVRREDARRTAVGRGPPLGRDAVLDPARRGRAGRGVPCRDGRGGPAAAAQVRPGAVPVIGACGFPNSPSACRG